MRTNGVRFCSVLTATLGLLCFAFAPSLQAAANLEKYDNVEVYGERTVKDLQESTREGAISWKTLKGVYVKVDGMGPDATFFPEYEPEVASLDGKEIEIEGFLFPLTPTDDDVGFQSRFLLSSLPPSCPFYHLYGMEQIIEVNSSNPVEFRDGLVRLRGELKLEEKSTTGIFYKMKEAEVVAN